MLLAACSSARATRAHVETTTAPTTRSTTTTTLPPTTTTTIPRVVRVSETTVVYSDGTRATPARGSVAGHAGRTLTTTIRWPATADGKLAPGDHPLVVFAHGYNVRGNTYAALLDDLARAGAIVAAPELPGESTALAGPANENDLQNEPCDLRYLATAVKSHPPAALAEPLATAPVIYAGHSDGATAAVAAAYWQEPCAGPNAVAVVAMSPNDMSIDRAPSGGAPALLLMTGAADTINPAANTQRLWQHAPAPAWLVTLDGGSHLGTFTTDPARPAIDAIAAAFVMSRRVRNDATNGQPRIHVYAR